MKNTNDQNFFDFVGASAKDNTVFEVEKKVRVH